VLNAIYEEDFLGFSYGSGPKRALAALLPHFRSTDVTARPETIPVNPSVNFALVAKLACSRSPDGFKAPTVLAGRTPCSMPFLGRITPPLTITADLGGVDELVDVARMA
jgi:hypothetical protein